jgi:hypothetical protein
MRRAPTLVALPLALILALGACSSSSDDGEASNDDTTTTAGSGAPLEGSTVGITDDALNVSIVFADTAALAETGLVPDIGDPVQDYKVFADLANRNDGAAGRNIVVTSHDYPPGSTATDQQPACVQATEDDQAAIVVFIGGFAAETALCVTEEHERIAFAQSGVVPQDIYDRSGSRFFNHAMSADRLMKGWVAALHERGELEGKTLGLVRADQPDHEATGNALAAALRGSGYELTEQVALPCEATSCSQLDNGVELLQSSNVDTVFSLLSALPNPSFVSAAAAANYEPSWLASDFENQVFDVTAQFMDGVKEPYDGTIGFSYGLEEPPDDPFGRDCMAKFKAETGTEYEYDTDAWRQVRSACYSINEIVAAAKFAQDTHGALNQATLIAGFESLTEYKLGDQVGGWSETKHDAADSVVLKTFGADCLCWTEIEGTRDVFTG